MKSTTSELSFLKPLALPDICNVNDLNNVSDISNLTCLQNLKYVPLFVKMEPELKHTPLLLPPTWKQFITDLRRTSVMNNHSLKKLVCSEVKNHNLQELHDGLYREELEAYFVFTQIRRAVGKSIKDNRKSLGDLLSMNDYLRNKQLIDCIEIDMMTTKINSLNYIFKLRNSKADNMHIPDTLKAMCTAIDTGQEVMDHVLNMMFNIQTRIVRLQNDVEDIKTSVKLLNAETSATTTTTVLKSLYDSYNADETESTSTEPDSPPDNTTVTTIGDVPGT